MKSQPQGATCFAPHRQLGKEGEEGGRERRREMLSIPIPASSLLLTVLVKVSWFFIQLKYVTSPIILRLPMREQRFEGWLFFYLNPLSPISFFPILRRDWGPFIRLHTLPFFVSQYSSDQKTSITALSQQGASSLTKIRVRKILEDERDTLTPSGVIFLSQMFSQLNVCVNVLTSYVTGLCLAEKQFWN